MPCIVYYTQLKNYWIPSLSNRAYLDLVFVGSPQICAFSFSRRVIPWTKKNSIYIHTHTHTYIYIHTHTYIYIHTHTHIYIYIHTHTHIYIYTHTHIYIYIYIYIAVQQELAEHCKSTIRKKKAGVQREPMGSKQSVKPRWTRDLVGYVHLDKQTVWYSKREKNIGIYSFSNICWVLTECQAESSGLDS